MNESCSTIFIQQQLQELRAGHHAGRDAIVAFAIRRQRQLAQHMLRDFPHVSRFEESDDLLQRSALRLQQALTKVVPENPIELLRLTAQHMRYELIDLARYYRRRQLAPQPEDLGDGTSSRGDPIVERSDSTYHPGRLAEWTSIHEKIALMPDELRQVVELHWYHDLNQVEVAELLGVDRRTIIRRWQKARLLLQDLIPSSQSASGEEKLSEHE